MTAYSKVTLHDYRSQPTSSGLKLLSLATDIVVDVERWTLMSPLAQIGPALRRFTRIPRRCMIVKVVAVRCWH